MSQKVNEAVTNDFPPWWGETPYGKESGHVGKYDVLWVWQNRNGRRWSVHLGRWVTQKSEEWTSFLETLVTNPTDHSEGHYINEYADQVAEHGELPAGGKLIDINES